MSDPMDEYDRLLREVDQALAASERGSLAPTGAGPPSQDVARSKSTSPSAVSAAPVALGIAGLTAAGVWLLFLLLPFLGALSGAVGAFLGALVTALVLPRVRRG